jgi:hypothetical protein
MNNQWTNKESVEEIRQGTETSLATHDTGHANTPEPLGHGSSTRREFYCN